MQSDREQSSGILKQLKSLPCTYPVTQPFGIAARPKRCGKSGGILSLVPYPSDEEGFADARFQHLCLAHASEVAVWRYLNTSAAVVEEEHDV